MTGHSDNILTMRRRWITIGVGLKHPSRCRHLLPREPIQWRTFGKFFVMAVLYLYLVYSATLIIPFAHHDQTRYFREDFNDPAFKSNSDHDYQYGFIHLIGRPIAAELEAMVFRNAHQLTDLVYFRAVVIVLLAVGMALLGAILVSLGLGGVAAFCLSGAIFTLPGVQNTIFMTNMPNALSPLLAMLAWMMLSASGEGKTPTDRHRGHKGRMAIFLAVAFLLTAMFTYPALAFFYLVPVTAGLLFGRCDSWRKIRLAVVRDIGFLGFVSLLYFAGVRLVIYTRHAKYVKALPNDWRFHPSFEVLLTKIRLAVVDLGPLIFNLWNIYTVRAIGIVLACVVGGALLIGIMVPRLRAFSGGLRPIQGVERVVVLVVIFFLVNLVWIIAPAGYVLFRFLLAGTAVAMVLVFWAGRSVLLSLGSLISKSRPHFLVVVWAGLILLVGTVMASVTTTKNVWNTNIEHTYIQIALEPYLDQPIERIHIVRPVDNGLGYNGLPSKNDEFNRKNTDFWQDMTEVVRISLLGMADPRSFTIYRNDGPQEEAVQQRPKGHILVTQSLPGEPIYESPHMVIVDMNCLVRAMGIPMVRMVRPDAMLETHPALPSSTGTAE